MFSLFNFSSIFSGGSADPTCPYVRTPMLAAGPVAIDGNKSRVRVDRLPRIVYETDIVSSVWFVRRRARRVDAVRCCRWRSSVVRALASPAKTAEPIETLFGVASAQGPDFQNFSRKS